jgi:hypothetical protein
MQEPMRKLPFLLVLLLLSLLLLAAAASAHALTLPPAGGATTSAVFDDDEEEADDDSEAGDEGDEEEVDDETEACESEDEEAEERCEEELAEAEEDEECLLKDARASFVAAPGAGAVRLTIHYRTFEPASVVVDARLHGGKGGLRLGSDRTRFHRAGVYQSSFELGPKQLAKALAARELDVDLHATGTPADCGLHISTRAHRRAK